MKKIPLSQKLLLFGSIDLVSAQEITNKDTSREEVEVSIQFNTPTSKEEKIQFFE